MTAFRSTNMISLGSKQKERDAATFAFHSILHRIIQMATEPRRWHNTQRADALHRATEIKHNKNKRAFSSTSKNNNNSEREKNSKPNKQTAHSAIEREGDEGRPETDLPHTKIKWTHTEFCDVFYCFHRTSMRDHPHTGLRRVAKNKQTCAAHADWQGESCDPCTNFHSKDKTKHHQQKKEPSKTIQVENEFVVCIAASQHRNAVTGHATHAKWKWWKQSNRRWGNYTTQTYHFPSPKSEIQIQQIVCRILLKGLITLTIKIPLIVSVENGTVHPSQITHGKWPLQIVSTLSYVNHWAACFRQ